MPVFLEVNLAEFNGIFYQANIYWIPSLEIINLKGQGVSFFNYKLKVFQIQMISLADYDIFYKSQQYPRLEKSI